MRKQENLRAAIRRIAATYRKRLSNEEARGGFVWIAKHWLSFFPQPGERFALRHGRAEISTALESTDCDCTGKLHKHYLLRLRSIKLKKGQLLAIVKNGSYDLTLQ